jgi:hypothetical protein
LLTSTASQRARTFFAQRLAVGSLKPQSLAIWL